MKTAKILFIIAVFAVLTLTACSKEQPAPSTQPGSQPDEQGTTSTAPDDIDTSELDQLEQDLSTIEQQGY